MIGFLTTGARYVYSVFNKLGLATTLGIVAVGVVGGVIVRYQYHLNHARADVAAARDSLRTTRMAASNLRAEADTTRRLAVVLADSLSYYARLARQTSPGRGLRDVVLERRLNAEVQAKAELATKVVRLEAMLEAQAEGLGDTLTASFDLRRVPYTVKAKATLVRPPRASTLDFGVALDTIPMTLLLTCKPGAGVREAEAVVGVPAWATVGLRSVSQDATICNPAPAPVVKKPSRSRWFGAGLVAGIAVAVGVGLP